MSTEQACMTCRFWRAGNQAGTVGECLRFPPVLIDMSSEVNDESVEDKPDSCKWSYPATTRYDWCGEWSDKAK